MRNPFSMYLLDPDLPHAHHLWENEGQENVEVAHLQRYLCFSFQLSWALELHERHLVV